MKQLTCLLLTAAIATYGTTAMADSHTPRIDIETTLGKIVLELEAEKAPRTVENFLSYIDDGFYDGLIFHRVIPGFMVQGGGFSPEMEQKETRDPIPNEADNGLKNLAGTIAMARTQDPHSATAQFFINVNDNVFLDHRGKTPDGWGYAVFGRVVEGMEVVNEIVAVPTTSRGMHTDIPRDPVVMTRVSRASE